MINRVITLLTIVYPILFMSETQQVGSVNWKKLGLTDPNLENAQTYVGFFGPKSLDEIRVIQYGEDLSVPNLESDEYSMLYLCPVWKLKATQVALLGELDKYVLVSNDRIKYISLESNIWVDTTSIKLGLKVRSPSEIAKG